jgi:hypothetical protein
MELDSLPGKLYPFISSFIDSPRIGLKRREVVLIRRALGGFTLSVTEASGVASIRPAEMNPLYAGLTSPR